jgi:hypothetical protein
LRRVRWARWETGLCAVLQVAVCTLSSAFVVWITRRIVGGKAKKGITCGQARRHDATTVGHRVPHGPCSKVSSAAAASALVAV